VADINGDIRDAVQNAEKNFANIQKNAETKINETIDKINKASTKSISQTITGTGEENLEDEGPSPINLVLSGASYLLEVVNFMSFMCKESCQMATLGLTSALENNREDVSTEIVNSTLYSTQGDLNVWWVLYGMTILPNWMCYYCYWYVNKGYVSYLNAKYEDYALLWQQGINPNSLKKPYTVFGKALPPGGSYDIGLAVALTSPSVGSTIYYTLDGTVPNKQSSVYSEPIFLLRTTQISFIVITSDNNESMVYSYWYGIKGTVAQTEVGTATVDTTTGKIISGTASPYGGSFTTPQTVILGTSTPDADIYYTLDGTDPTEQSTKYNVPIIINETTNLKFKVFAPDGQQSTIYSEWYGFKGSNATTAGNIYASASPYGGSFTEPQTVIITSSTYGAKIHYTITGIAPTTSSEEYAEPITIDQTTNLQFFAVAPDGTISKMYSYWYGFKGTSNTGNYTVYGNASPYGGSYATPQEVVLSSSTVGAIIYYTLDGSLPNTNGDFYTNPIEISQTTNLQFIVLAPNGVQSQLYSYWYGFKGSTPVLTANIKLYANPVSGSYMGTQYVTIVCSQGSTQIVFTLDDSDPTETSTGYAQPIEIDNSCTLKVMAISPIGVTSDILQEDYIISQPTT
jgi:hypothetical protein